MSAQHRLSTAVNSAMVTTYWEIGEQIFKVCGENDRAEYGKKLLESLSEQLTAEFGKGFDKSTKESTFKDVAGTISTDCSRAGSAVISNVFK